MPCAACTRRKPGFILRAGTLRRVDRFRSGGFPDRRPAGQDGRPSPAGDAGRHGGQIRRRIRWPVWPSLASRMSRSGDWTIPSRFRARSVFWLTAHFGSYVHGLEEYPEETWPDNIELLYYSFHIMITLGTIFILLMAYADFRAFARPAEFEPMVALGADAGVSFSLHRQYPGMDDCRAWTAAVADLRPFSHARRLQQGGEQRRHHFHADRLYRSLFCARSAFSFPGWSRDWPRPGRRRSAVNRTERQPCAV